MRRIALLLICILILNLCACKKQQEEIQLPTNFYYSTTEISYNTKSGVINSEVREGIDFQGNLQLLLQEYLQGPHDLDLQALIPSDVTIISCTVTDNAANITFSDSFAKLTGIKLSIACSSLLMTINEYSGFDTLSVRAENSLIDDKDEITITMDDILLLDSTKLGE